MTHRNDHDAALARVEVLEREAEAEDRGEWRSPITPLAPMRVCAEPAFPMGYTRRRAH